MRKKVFILVSFVLLIDAILMGQCPERSVLLKRMYYLKDSSKASSKDQLAELLGYLEKINSCPYPDDSIHAMLLKRIGATYFFQADYLKAVNYYRQAINIIAANAGKSSVNPKELPGCYFWLAIMYEALNNVTEKMKLLDSCYITAMRLKYIDRSCLKALYMRTEYFYDIGDYRRCIEYADRCKSLADEYSKNNINPLAERKSGEEFASSSLLWSVKALLELKSYDDAERRLAHKIEECQKAGLYNYFGTIFSQLAEVEERKKNYKNALSFYNKAFKYDKEVGYNFNCKQTLKDIGYNIFFKHFNDGDKALVYYRKALKLINKDESKKESDVFESLNIFCNIADVYVAKGLYDSAYHYFQLAFDQIKSGSSEADLLHSSTSEFIRHKKIHYLTRLFIDKGDAFRKQYEDEGQQQAIQKAIDIYRMADQLLDRIKTEQTELESKLFWRSDSRRLYENAIGACYLQGNSADAFYFFEKSRAVLLQDQLNEQHWSGEQDILKQTQLEKKILQLERELNNSNKTLSNYSELENELFNSKEELGRVRELVKTNNPLYYQSFVDKNFITIKDVGDKILRDHQAVVELFAGDSSVYILVIAEQKSYLEKINKIDFDRLSDGYRDYISNQDLINKHFIEFKNLSLQLYRLIFQNINLPIGRIIISPDGKYFPFEALVTNTQPLTYFLEDHAVSYTYSARYLLNNFNIKSTSNSYTFMGIAPVKYYNNLPSLSGSEQSLQKIKNYFRNAINFIGSKASKDNFLNEYDKYKIIQLYTHATDGGLTGEPLIYFSDSVLALSDLFYESKPATSLIVLSACETAGGKLYNGEGVFSFNRQFAALGIPSCVSNLWKIDNRSTYKLTELFYKYIANGMPLDIALQKAKKEFRKTASSKEQDLPYYWAAPILVGQTNEVPLSKTFPWKWVALVSFLLALCNWGLRKFISNRPASSLKGL